MCGACATVASPFGDGERIDDITAHPRFKIPIASTAADYAYDEPERGGAFARYGAECGRRALDEFEIQCSVKN